MTFSIFSKIEAGKIELEQDYFNCKDCLENVLDFLAPQSFDQGIELVSLFTGEIPDMIQGDETRLRQILVNLIGNALKFTDGGEIAVLVNSRQISERPNSAYELQFAIRDTGIGIHQDRMNCLFKLFSQVDSSSTRKYGGSGLGLVICKNLSELMGGQIWLESRGSVGGNPPANFTAQYVDQPGCTFYFTIIANGQFTDGKKNQSKLAGLKGKNILIIDKNVTRCQRIRQQCQNQGIQITETRSVQKALELISSTPYDGLFVDDRIYQDYQGDFLDITNLSAKKPLPLILVTSLYAGKLQEYKKNFAGVLPKPIKKSKLDNILSSIFLKPIKSVDSSSRINLPKLDGKMAERLPLKILIAEDHRINLKLAIRLLKKMGYQPDVAVNGLEVLTALEQKSYDVILMDIHMPEMDGLEATRKICSECPESERPQIIAMTANAMQGDREQCLAAGMNDYVSKPIQFEKLVEALSKCQPRC
jgi:CheY-like chemotaxis protein